MKNIKVKLLLCIFLLGINFNCLNIQPKEVKEGIIVLSANDKADCNNRSHDGGPII